MWREIRKYKVVSSDGTPETMILERNDDGNFRLRNDFGNVSIEFELMSGTELFRNILEDISDQVELDLMDVWDDLTEEDDIGDCDGQPT